MTRILRSMTKASTRTASIGEDAVAGRLRAAGFELAPAPCAALTAYLELLAQWNRVFNLTGIRSREALVQRHVVESLTLGPLLRGGRVADVGTGAGLPGIPLAITAPEREFTLIESRAKRVRFLRHVVSMLGLDNAASSTAASRTYQALAPLIPCSPEPWPRRRSSFESCGR